MLNKLNVYHIPTCTAVEHDYVDNTTVHNIHNYTCTYTYIIHVHISFVLVNYNYLTCTCIAYSK